MTDFALACAAGWAATGAQRANRLPSSTATALNSVFRSMQRREMGTQWISSFITQAPLLERGGCCSPGPYLQDRRISVPVHKFGAINERPGKIVNSLRAPQRAGILRNDLRLVRRRVTRENRQIELRHQ